MRFRIAISVAVAASAAILLMPAAAQTGNYGPPGTSYAREAALNPKAASKPTPRTPDGHPDLNGVWHHFFGAGSVEKVSGNSFSLAAIGGRPVGGLALPQQPDPKPDYKPQYREKVKYLSEHQVEEDHTLHCQPPGIPRMGPPHQIVQSPKQAVFLYADLTGNQWRTIPLDGRTHSTGPDAGATNNGDSVGHWEGDTLVVDVTRLSDETWLDDNGLLHSDKLHVTERLRRVGDTIEYSMTADDPVVLAKPWTVKRTLTLQSDTLDEAPACVDRDAGHYVNLDHHDNGR
jgi:hypothetical protein